MGIGSSTIAGAMLCFAWASCVLCWAGEASPATRPQVPTSQRTALYDYDPTVPLDIQEIKVEVRGNMIVRDLTFASLQNGQIKAYLVVPPGQGPFAGVIYVHWLGSPDTANRSQFLDEAVDLARSGVVSLLVDAVWAAPKRFPWTGKDDGRDRATTVKQVVELRRAIDVLLKQPNVDANRLGYVGHDFGAMVGGGLAGVDKRIRTYVLIAGTPRYAYWFLRWSPLKGPAREEYARKMAEVDPVNFIGQAAPASVYFQFSRGKDEWVSEKEAQEYFAAASQPKKISWYDVGHALDDAQVREHRLKWLREQLGLTQAE